MFCRCGGLFCSIHRYSDKHQCDFDYKVVIPGHKLIFWKETCIILIVQGTVCDCFCDVMLLQALGAEEITRSNPVVVAQKVAKI